MFPTKIGLGISLIGLLLLTAVVNSPSFGPVRAQSQPFNISQEYSSGDVQVFPYLQAWYTWVNVNGTHLIFLALHSTQYPSPVSAFVGQGYNVSSSSRVFVANVLTQMEVFNDTNKNGFLDANYNTPTPTTELLYTIAMNASQTFTTTPVHKTYNNGVPHYLWGASYGAVQAYLLRATPPDYGYGGGSTAYQIMIDHVSMLYDYSISQNTTFLKTGYEIGNVTFVPPITPGVTLQGLSLSLLHTTVTVSSNQFTVLANSSPFDSQTSTAASLVNLAQVRVGNALAYEFRFGDNYTLLTNPAVTYPAVYVASPSSSLPATAFQGQSSTSLIRVQDYVRASLPDIAGLPSTSSFNYNTSTLLYRISYPTWSGYSLTHDPTLVAHFVPGLAVSIPAPGLPLGILSIAIVTGLLGIMVAIAGLRRQKRVEPGEPSQNLAAPDATSAG